MSSIRRQSIVSSILVYFGFALGFFNTYLFTRQGGFSEAQYGLTGTFIAIANIMFSVASLGMPAFIGKFFPYYNSHLTTGKNDMATWALLIPCVGFLFVIAAGVGFKNILIDKVFNNSPELLQYYYWLFPFGFGLTLFVVLEAYAWQQRKAILSNFLKEVLFRIFITVLIVLTTYQVISGFDAFIKLYAFLYILLALVLIIYLFRTKKLSFVFSVSKVTKRFFRKILALVSFTWAGGLVFTIASVFDTIVLAAVLPNGMAVAGIFVLAQNISSLIQAPQRGIISASIGPLSQAWKEKNYEKINKIYQRSSINQLIFSCAMFCLIWLNFEDGINTFNLKPSYLQAMYPFFFIGLTRIIDMGTGVNSQIIGTSVFWRFEFVTGLVLLSLALPLNYIITRQLGVVGPAISNLIAFTIYNLLRYLFLLRKFSMQPFTIKSLYTVLLAGFCYYVCYLLFSQQTGFLWIVLRSTFFSILFVTGAITLKLSPDVKPVLESVQNRLRL
ncbi:MAG: lipopolysaccharide biosynthesis protein [Chitinophagaceae bacterium]